VARYETYKDYADRIGTSLSSVYRAARKGKLKTTMINGISHVIIDDEIDDSTQNNFHYDKVDKEDKFDFHRSDKSDKSFEEAEIIEPEPSIKYNIDIFRDSIATIETMAGRITQAKDETIETQREIIDNHQNNIEKLQNQIDNLQGIIQTISNDNQQLRIQIAIRESELSMCEKKNEKADNMISENEKLIDNLLKEIDKTKLENTKLQEENEKLVDKLKEKDDKIKLLEAKPKETDFLKWPAKL
jgi:chromosome segregation ATPase